MKSGKTTIAVSSVDKKGKVKTTKIGEPKPMFTALVRECELAMNMSYDAITTRDSEGNEIRFHLWVNGDWKVEYKGKEYLIALEDNVNAFIEWLKEQEKK